MKSLPGNIYRNINRNIGVGKFTMDTVIKQHIPEPVVEHIMEPIIEESFGLDEIDLKSIEIIEPKIEEETKIEKNELRRTQMEQKTLPSGSEYTRNPSPGHKQNPSGKSRI